MTRSWLATAVVWAATFNLLRWLLDDSAWQTMWRSGGALRSAGEEVLREGLRREPLG